MAVLYPEYETITNLRQEPTKGELHLLRFLKRTLNDDYEVFFQPFLNGDMPDIIIMKEGSGVYVIEVKDWDLEHYSLNDRNRWFVQSSDGNSYQIPSPVEQVFKYKENLYNLHVEGLLEKKIKNPKMLAIVNCGVYFHNSTTEDCNAFFHQNYEEETVQERGNGYLKFLSYFDLFGRDSLNRDDFMGVMKKRRMEYNSRIFDESLYKSFKRILKPPRHVVEQGILINYTSGQQKIIESSPGNRQKVKGVAGSGKTMCLAKRAVNAFKQHGEDILILTFNISLRNYIRDKISEVREDFPWKHFHIIHYHEFFKSQANNYGVKIGGYESWKNQKFFDRVENKIRRFKTVIIDEVQDYEKAWIEIINKYFLEENGEYVVFGDEKQNIYQIVYDVEERKPYTKIGGAWNVLNESFRVSNDIARLAETFQNEFFDGKYEIDEMIVQRSLFEQSFIKYVCLDSFNDDKIIKLYKDTVENLEVHDNDVCFQSARVDPLRSLDYEIRKQTRQKTNTMFETQEVYDKLYKEAGLNNQLNGDKRIKSEKLFNKKIEKVRRNKKFNFWNNRGILKLSTIHSFKGWEVNTLFLLIDEEVKENYVYNELGIVEEAKDFKFTTDELIYTAITRCRNNLIILNTSDNKYHEFFIKQDFEKKYIV